MIDEVANEIFTERRKNDWHSLRELNPIFSHWLVADGLSESSYHKPAIGCYRT